MVSWWIAELVDWWIGELVDWQIRRKLNFVSRIDQRESVIPQFLAKNLRNRLICVPIGIKVGTRILKIKRVFA
ncbi:MAG: hypothetical protein KBB64_10675, partial [Bacteroidia bacterium]|nr:hypothetical protein [Bacteroidia bacterium]